jgi:hypothetical protein
MDKVRKLELVMRSLGIRHKLKVIDSMKPPETHEDLAHQLLSRWELEDELKAIELMLEDAREINVSEKRATIEREGRPGKKKPKNG